jgi:hypothetical protein
MIDFSKITKTLHGYDCHYFGMRESFGTQVHCFGVWTPNGVTEKCYDAKGKHIVYDGQHARWKVSTVSAFDIVKPPKIVSVSRWITYHLLPDGDISCRYHQEDPAGLHLERLLYTAQITREIEVPNE